GATQAFTSEVEITLAAVCLTETQVEIGGGFRIMAHRIDDLLKGCNRQIVTPRSNSDIAERDLQVCLIGITLDLLLQEGNRLVVLVLIDELFDLNHDRSRCGFLLRSRRQGTRLCRKKASSDRREQSEGDQRAESGARQDRSGRTGIGGHDVLHSLD